MKAKYMIMVVALFLVAATPIVEAKTQTDTQNTMSAEMLDKPAVSLDNTGERAPFTAPPSYAAPPDGGNSQKEIDAAPVSGGIWILAGLVMAYGLVCRRRNKG